MPARTPTPQERGSPFCTTKPWPIFKHLGGFGNLSLFPPSLPYPVPGQCPQAGLPRCPQPEEKPTRSGPDSTGSTSPPAPHRFADPTRQRSVPSLLPLHSHSSPVSSRTQASLKAKGLQECSQEAKDRQNSRHSARCAG